MNEHRFDIFTISKIWLDPSVESCTVQLPGFLFFRQDLGDHKFGGGLGIYIRDTYKASLIENMSMTTNDNFQKLWVKVQVRKCKSFIICTVYHPPSATMAWIDVLTQDFAELLLLGQDIIILGNLNCNLLTDTAETQIILDFCATFNLVQLVDEPTKGLKLLEN